MAKTKTAYFCQNCGTQHSKWMGQCSTCKEWNTIVEEVVVKEEKVAWKIDTTPRKANVALKVKDIEIQNEVRYNAVSTELNNVLGGGIVPGSVILLGGEPGIGKSTLMLQVALSMKHKVLYVSGEESQTQIKLRAERVQNLNQDCLILTETNTQKIFKAIQIEQPEI